MIVLVAGLIIFLGSHSLRIFAEDRRGAAVARLGERRWKGLFSLVSALGLVLIIWGYGLARQNPVVLWGAPPAGVRHFSAVLVLIAFILVAAAYTPRNQIRARLHHPMILGVKVWAFAHLIANNTLADLVLFGAFLAWAVADFASARRRDRAARKIYTKGAMAGTAAAVAIGAAAWAGFAFWAHAVLIGVDPLA